MEIRKDAWHYRFFTFAHEGCPPSRTNLCSYFWRTVFGLAACVFLACLAGAFIYGAGYALYFHTYNTVACVALAAAIIGFLVYRDQHRFERVGKEPGLVVSYLAARKSKMCPLITFTEVEES